MTTTYKAYKAAREWAKGRPLRAKDALAYLRSQEKTARRLPDLEWRERGNGATYAYDVDGWHIVIKAAYDDSSIDWGDHGAFTDEWRKGCLVNPRYSPESRYYRGRNYSSDEQYHYSDNCKGIAEYAHKAGASRHEAWLIEQAARHQEMEWCQDGSDLTYYQISATASYKGVELGFDSVGGVDVAGGLSDPYITETAAEMAEGALENGRQQLAALKAS